MPDEANVDWRWAAIYIGLIVAFVAVELCAVFNRKAGDTFSELVWWIIGHKGWGSLFLFAFVALHAWLVWHFIWERPS